MIKRLTLICLLTAFIFGCSSQAKEEDNYPQQPPQAFDESKIGADIVLSKRYGEDVVDQLFDEYLEIDQNLNTEVEGLIKLTRKIDKDKDPFFKYKENNRKYYSSSNFLVNTITDSTLASLLQNKLKNSEQKYEKRIQAQEKLVSSLSEEVKESQDLLTAIKILKTLEMVELYQKESFPTDQELKKDLQEVKRKQEQLQSHIKPSL